MASPDADRFARQTALPGFGPEAQARLRGARVLVVGLGGLGSPAAMALAGMGVGRLELADFDAVDASNLHRQLWYTAGDVGRDKGEVLRERVRALDPAVEVVLHGEVTGDNAADLVRGCDVVVDGTDQLEVRYALNAACVAAGVPLVHGAVQRFEGQVAVLCRGDGPCYHCLFPPPEVAPASCVEAGVLGAVPNVVGMVQAVEAAKLAAGVGEPLSGRMLLYDALEGGFREVDVARRGDCPACGDGATAPSPQEGEGGGRLVQQAVPQVTPEALRQRLDDGEDLLVVDVREPAEREAYNPLEDSLHIPLMQVPGRVEELPRDKPVVFLCHAGGRSMQAAMFTSPHGVRAENLAGGVVAWSRLD